MTRESGVFACPFDELEVGDEFVSATRTLDEWEVISFAALTGDHHPQHVDASFARRSPFGERIAHGMLVLSLGVGLVPFEPDRVIALRRLRDAVFKAPVRFGDTVRVEGRIVRLTPAGDEQGIVGWAWSIRNQEDVLVARAEIDVLWRREAATPEPAFWGDELGLVSPPL